MYNIGYKENERKWLQMANLYTIEKLLRGKEYNSKSLIGEIITAEKSDQWFGRNFQAYKVLVRTPYSIKDYYRIIAVQVGDED